MAEPLVSFTILVAGPLMAASLNADKSEDFLPPGSCSACGDPSCSWQAKQLHKMYQTVRACARCQEGFVRFFDELWIRSNTAPT